MPRITLKYAERLERNGFNEFKKKKHTSLFVKFLNQFKSFMIIVLIAAAAVSGIVGVMHGEGITDAIIILAIIIINAFIGVFQEAKAESALDALEKMSAPHCKVVRNGEVQVIRSRELVVGDIVVIETGDSVPADLRLIEAVNLKIQEAALTGESVPVDKDTETLDEEVGIGDRINMAFSSTSVTYGHGKGIVVATGQNTEVGKIAEMIQSVEEIKTPMQQRLDQQIHGQLAGQQTFPIIECKLACYAAWHAAQITLRQFESGLQHIHQGKNNQISQQYDCDHYDHIVRVGNH